MKLYEISDAIEKILAFGINAETGEIDPVTEQELDSLNAQKEEKILDCIRYRQGTLSEAEAVRKEAAKLERRAKILEGQAEWLEGYIRRNVEPGETYHSPTASLSWRKSERVEALEGEEVGLTLLGPEFVRTKITHAPDKTKIREVLKQGAEVKGWVLKTYQNLVLKTG